MKKKILMTIVLVGSVNLYSEGPVRINPEVLQNYERKVKAFNAQPIVFPDISNEATSLEKTFPWLNENSAWQKIKQFVQMNAGKTYQRNQADRAMIQDLYNAIFNKASGNQQTQLLESAAMNNFWGRLLTAAWDDLAG